MGDPATTDSPVDPPVDTPVRRHGRRLAVGIVGSLVVLVGLVLMPLPGPGLLVVLAGLAILASEFAPAAAALHWLRSRARGSFERLRRWRRGGGGGAHS